MSKTSKVEIEYVKPRNILREKVGFGGIPKKLLIAAEKVLKEFEFDFQTFGNELLERFRCSIEEAHDAYRNKEKEEEQIKHLLLFSLANVMEIKANGGMFGAPVMSQTADISLIFLEKIDQINEDTFELLKIHYRVLHLVHTKQIKDLKTPEASALITELRRASERYFSKYGS